MRNLILGLSLSVAFIVGCVAGPALLPRTTAAPSGATASGVQKWEYTCFQYDFSDEADGIDGGKIKKLSNTAGRLGWEMVSGIVHNDPKQRQQNTIWCFKRRLP